MKDAKTKNVTSASGNFLFVNDSIDKANSEVLIEFSFKKQSYGFDSARNIAKMFVDQIIVNIEYCCHYNTEMQIEFQREAPALIQSEE